MDVDIEYEFDLEPEITIDYRISKQILEWLKENHIADDPVNDLIFANCED